MAKTFKQFPIPVNMLTLTFNNPEDEARFVASINDSRRVQLRLSFLLVSMVYVLTMFIEPYIIRPEILAISSLLHVGVVAPMGMLVVLVSFVERLKRFLLPVAIFATATAAVSNLYMVSLAGLQSHYEAEIYVMIFWIFTVASYRLIVATFLSAAIVFTAMLTTLFVVSTSDNSAQQYSYFFWLEVSFILAFLGGYLLELTAKYNFYHAEKLLDEIKERQAAQQQLQYMAYHDSLTNVPNRVLLYDRLEHAIFQADRNNEKLAWMFVDLDKFKQINDTLGHAVGDALLKEVAKRLKMLIRKSDTIGRIGGDEFIVLLSDVETPEAAVHIAEKIRETLAIPYVLEGSEPFENTASIGIALYPEHGKNERELSKRADNAMYLSKKKGRNRVTLFHEGQNTVSDSESPYVVQDESPGNH